MPLFLTKLMLDVTMTLDTFLMNILILIVNLTDTAI